MKLRFQFLIFSVFILVGLTVGFSARAASGTCPTDNGAGVGCNIGIGEYYCLSACRTGQTQCPSWTGTICASGLTCPANCASADSCGYCNSCASGYTLCGSYPSQTCTANTTAPSNCTSYNQCTATCSACAQGYELTAGLCVGATLKLGSDSVGALNHIFQSTSPALYVLPSGNVGIGTSTPVSALEVLPASGYAILAGLFKIGNVDYPMFEADAATKGYVDASLFEMASSTSLWGGSTSGNIWNLNSGNVGIGITNPGSLFHVAGVTTLQSGDANGGVRIGADVSATTLSSNVRKLGRVTAPSYSNGYYYSLFSADSDTGADGVEFGGRPGATNPSPTYISFATTPTAGSAAGNAERMRIIAGGNVGIGTSNPIYGRLQITDSGTYADGITLYAGSGNIASSYLKSDGAGDFNWHLTRGGSDTLGIVIKPNGNVGIGTTTPTARLSVVPASGYAILAGLFKIGNVDYPMFEDDAATKGYVDAALSVATSTMTSISSFVGVTSATFSGNNSGNAGYAYAHAQCNAVYSGSHVCAAFEILNTIKEGGTPPDQDAWIFNGPPAYTALANDCDARTSGSSAAYGAYWQKPATGYAEGRGLLMQCNNVLRFACCQ